MLIRNLLRHQPILANKLILYQTLRAGRRGVAHHGIQRSGTNYLNECLWRCGHPPLNAYCEARDSPRHKHCRWYRDKSSIPAFLAHQFGNDFRLTDIDALNSIAGYPDGTCRHVMKKVKTAWLSSIMNWGIACDWFRHREDALRHLNILAVDFDIYHDF